MPRLLQIKYENQVQLFHESIKETGKCKRLWDTQGSELANLCSKYLRNVQFGMRIVLAVFRLPCMLHAGAITF